MIPTWASRDCALTCKPQQQYNQHMADALPVKHYSTANTQHRFRGRKGRALKLRAQGKTGDSIAQCIGIDRVTLWRWRQADTQFSEAWEEAGRVCAMILEDALSLCALAAPGDPRFQPSLFFALKNRLPELYSDRQELRHTGGLGVLSVGKEDVLAADLAALLARTRGDTSAQGALDVESSLETEPAPAREPMPAGRMLEHEAGAEPTPEADVRVPCAGGEPDENAREGVPGQGMEHADEREGGEPPPV